MTLSAVIAISVPPLSTLIDTTLLKSLPSISLLIIPYTQVQSLFLITDQLILRIYKLGGWLLALLKGLERNGSRDLDIR